MVRVAFLVKMLTVAVVRVVFVKGALERDWVMDIAGIFIIKY
jgi:hypothetical protein